MAKKILIVEDEKSLAKVLQIKLTRSGFEVECALNGEEGIKSLEKNKYDLVLLDLVMPKKTGFEVLEEIKDKNIKTNVIVTSNLGQESDIKEAKTLGAVDFLVKSNTPMSEIVKHIEKFLNK